MSRRPVGQAGRRLKRVPFLHGVPVNLTPADKAMVLDIVDAAADATPAPSSCRSRRAIIPATPA